MKENIKRGEHDREIKAWPYGVKAEACVMQQFVLRLPTHWTWAVMVSGAALWLHASWSYTSAKGARAGLRRWARACHIEIEKIEVVDGIEERS